MSIWELYLLTRLDELSGFFRGIGIWGIMASGAVILYMVPLWHTEDIDFVDVARKCRLKLIIIVTLTSWFVSGLIPTTKEAYIIAGGYYVTNLEGVEKLPPNVVKAANKFIEQYTGVEDEK
jgi:hypothetical protein